MKRRHEIALYAVGHLNRLEQEAQLAVAPETSCGPRERDLPGQESARRQDQRSIGREDWLVTRAVTGVPLGEVSDATDVSSRARRTLSGAGMAPAAARGAGVADPNESVDSSFAL